MADPEFRGWAKTGIIRYSNFVLKFAFVVVSDEEIEFDSVDVSTA